MVNLKCLAQKNVFDGESVKEALSGPTLNRFASLPQNVRKLTRDRIIDLLEDPSSVLFKDEVVSSEAFVPVEQVKMHLPMQVGAFADFLCSETHLHNVGISTHWSPTPAGLPSGDNG